VWLVTPKRKPPLFEEILKKPFESNAPSREYVAFIKTQKDNENTVLSGCNIDVGTSGSNLPTNACVPNFATLETAGIGIDAIDAVPEFPPGLDASNFHQTLSAGSLYVHTEFTIT
jgi:hypothetical protein